MKLVDYSDSPYSKVTLSNNLINKLKKIVQRELGTDKKTPIGETLGIEPKAWNNFVQGEEIIVNTLETIRKFCNVSKDLITDGITSIDHIEDVNVPLDFDCEGGVRLDAGIYNEGRVRKRGVEYHNKDREIIKILVEAAKTVVGEDFKPQISVDERMGSKCIYFPPYFAKHYVKLGLAEKSKSSLKDGIPDYIIENKEYQRIWMRGTLSEDGCLYPFVCHKKGYGYYISPRIQINRVMEVDSGLDLPKETTFFRNDLPAKFSKYLRTVQYPLIRDEAEMMKNFDIHVEPHFSKLYVSRKDTKTVTYTILINKISDLEKWYENIGFELERQRKQLDLLLNARGSHSKDEISEIIFDFYSSIPSYIRGKRKIETNNWLNKEQKIKLLGGRNGC